MNRKKAKLWKYTIAFLAGIMLISASPVKSMASTGGHSCEEAVSWASSQVGKSLDYDGYYGAQCVDLIMYYYQYLGCAGYIGRNAVDYATKELPPGWTRVYGGYQPGDIAVWTPGAGGAHSIYGHIGIIESADSVGFNVIHQNWAGAEYCTKKWFNISNLQCAIRPDFQTHTHSYTSSVTRQPTCTMAGEKTFRCSCGSSYTEPVPMTGHQYTETVVPPTETEKGYTLHQCRTCGDSYKDHYTDPIVPDDGWNYCEKLPEGVTADKYTIEYKNCYEKTQQLSPGTDWKNEGKVREEWQNSGAPYKSYTDLPTSDARVLVSSIYYHWCGPNAGEYGNYEMSGNYVHYDSISGDGLTAQFVENDNGHPYYFLYWSDGNRVYCKSGETCDAAWGTHEPRSRAWYRENTYQDRVKVTLNKYTKEDSWKSSMDSSASKVTCRYKEKHAHSYNPVVTKFPTCSSEGERTYTCSCGDKYTERIAKADHVWNAGIITKAPTDQTAGEKTYTCTVCGAEKTEVLPAVKQPSAGDREGSGADHSGSAYPGGSSDPENEGPGYDDGSVGGDPWEEVKVSMIRISGSTGKLAKGKKLTLKALVYPADAEDPTVIWSSSNKKYASVSSKGVVTAKAAGAGKTVTITAQADDGSGVKATYKIQIMKGVVQKITLKGSSSVKAGKNLKLKTTVKATQGANKKLIYTSSNTKYATVTSSGLVKTKKAGKGKTVKITAKATDGSGKKATIKIKIK